MTIDPAAAGPDCRRRAARALQGRRTCSCRAFSGAYTLSHELGHPRRRRAVLRQAGRQRDLLADQPAAVRPERQRRERQSRQPARRRRGAASVLGNITALDPNMDVPRQLQYSFGVQRELPNGHFAEVTYVGNQGRHLLWQPNINIPSFEAELANALLPAASAPIHELPAALPGLLEHHAAPQRRLLGLQQRPVLPEQAPRRHPLLGQLHAGQGDRSRQRQRRQPARGRGLAPDRQRRHSYFVGPTSFDRRHALVIIPTYTPAFLRERRDILGQILGGWEISGKIRWQSGQYLTPTANTLIGVRRADYVGGDIGLDDRDETKWFNTAAFVAAPVDRRGNATVGMIQGPHWRQADISLRKRFRFSQTKNLEVRAEVFNVFNTLNLNNPNDADRQQRLRDDHQRADSAAVAVHRAVPVLVSSEGLCPSDSPAASLARRFAARSAPLARSRAPTDRPLMRNVRRRSFDRRGVLRGAGLRRLAGRVSSRTRLAAVPPLDGPRILIRGASPLGLPYTRPRSPLRRLAPVAWLTRCARSLRGTRHRLSGFRALSLHVPHSRDCDDEMPEFAAAGFVRRGRWMRLCRRGHASARGGR